MQCLYSMNYTKYRLGDIADVQISGVDKKTIDGEMPVRLCNFVDVYYNWAITKEMTPNLMVASAKEKEIDTFTLHRGQVAITKDSETRDDIGIATYIADDFDETVLLGYHTALITPDESIVNGKYLNALLHSKYFHDYWFNNASGSGMRYTLSEQCIRNAAVYLPSLDEQKKIGNILSSLDRKIALNRKANEVLESMAKQLYDYWFVQFDFPNTEGKPYKSSGGKMVYNETLKREIPEGWEVVCLGETFEHNRGISYNTQTITGDGIPMINLASFNVDGTYKPAGIKSYNGEYSEDKVLKPYDLVMCNTQQTAIDYSKDIIGKAFLVPDLSSDDIVSSHHVTTIKPYNNELKAYYCYLFNTQHFHKYAARCSSGTNIMGLDYGGIERYITEIPSQDLLCKFSEYIINIQKRKSLILKEILRLTSLRDYLLPLLMNGQVKVS